MRAILLLFIFTVSCLPASQDEIMPYLTSECDTLSLVEGVVNAQNGKLVQIDRDIETLGADPLDLTRYYDGGHHIYGLFGYGSSYSYPLLLKAEFFDTQVIVWVELRRGLDVYCKATKQGHGQYVGKVSDKYFSRGYTNCCEAQLRGEPSLYSMTIEGDRKRFLVKFSDGTQRFYDYFTIDKYTGKSGYRLVCEVRPNGNRRHYTYLLSDTLSLKRIQTNNADDTLTLNWIEFEQLKNEVRVTSSSGQKATYNLEKKKGRTRYVGMDGQQRWEEIKAYVLNKVSGDHLTTTNYEFLSHAKYEESLFSTKKVLNPEGRGFEVDYTSSGKVRNIGLNQSNLIYTFDYHKNFTDVTNALGGIKRYNYENHRLTELVEEHRTQKYSWNSKGQLTRHIILEGANIISQRDYEYDSYGNVTQIIVSGSITDKGSQDKYITRYTYSGGERSLLISEKHNEDKEYLYTYYPNTNLVYSKFTVVNDTIVEREFTAYDKNAIMVWKVIDDGSATERLDLTNATYCKITEIETQFDPTLPGFTLPHIIKETYEDPITRQRTLVKRVERTYTPGNLLTEEKVFDANDNYQYSLHYEYNNKSQLIRETNALGEETLYSYDANGNKISEEKAGRITRYTYDKFDRITREIEEHTDGMHKTSFTYNSMGNKTSIVDHLGNKTAFKYDKSSREICNVDALGKTELKEYDSQNNIIKFTDKDGNITTKTYNLYGAPFEIRYPDNTIETFAYNLQGHLIQKKNRDETIDTYKVDYLGRATSVTTYSETGTPLKTLHYKYKGKNLISEIDAMGNTTSYQYDGAGRQIAKIHEGIKTTYTYDSLGRPSIVTTSNKSEIKEYDYLDRIIEERTVDDLDKIFSKVQYTYDIHGNQILKREYTDPNSFAETITHYDYKNRVIEEIDSIGNSTRFNYIETNHLEKETIDAMGRLTLEIFNPLNRLTELRKYSSTHELLSNARFSYDGRGNKILHQEDVLYNGNVIDTYAIKTTYDCMNNKISESEQDLKTTSYSYNKDRLSSIVKPDGTILTHTYDPLGRLQELASSDNTIRFFYTYDLNNNLLEATDAINNTTTSRSYDNHNRLIQETLGTGFTATYTYDELNRLKEMAFLDCKITYEYSVTQLISASRYKQGELVYSYSQNHDWTGRIIQSQFPNNTLATYQRDKLGRILQIDAESYHQTSAYNAIGNMTEMIVADHLGSYSVNYAYDGLNQLLQESGPFTNSYNYDSINNRRSQNYIEHHIDSLNQLLNDGISSFIYDKNGRRISKAEAEYKYDALGRLLSITEGENQITYQYDPFGRCLKRITPSSVDYYLYQYDTEIGVFNGELKEFRMLQGKHAPVAIELDGNVYSPIRNHRGDICQLLDSQGKIVTNYRYDAFGIHDFSGNVKSPWLFSGQRYDEATLLYHFDKRIYDPHAGRWLTPDPLNFVDGPNLYAYVHNNPLIYIDPYGLWSIGSIFSDFGSTISMSCQSAQHYGCKYSRGFIDDYTSGASKQVLGEEKNETWGDTICYGAGVVTSLAVGLRNGNTQRKVVANLARKCLHYGYQWCRGEKVSETHKVTQFSKETQEFSKQMTDIIKNVKFSKPAQVVKESATEITKKSGRNRFVPDKNASGAHSVFRKDPASNKTTHYETYIQQTNSRNPNPWESLKRFDGNGRGHTNKVLEREIETPHVHDPMCPGGIRTPYLWEMPK